MTPEAGGKGPQDELMCPEYVSVRAWSGVGVMGKTLVSCFVDLASEQFECCSQVVRAGLRDSRCDKFSAVRPRILYIYTACRRKEPYTAKLLQVIRGWLLRR